MKKLILSILMLFSVATLGTSNYVTKYHSCSELNRFLNEDGIIRLEYGSIFGLKSRGYHHNTRNNCSECFHAVAGNVKASDQFFCRVGYKCVKRSRDWIDRQNDRRRDRGGRRLNCRKPY